MIRRISNNKICIAIIAAVVATITGLLVNHWLKGSSKLQVTLYQSIPNPQANGRIQFMVINSEGTCVARDIRVRVEYQRIIEPLDYRIDSLDPPENVLRTDSYLSFKITRLAAKDFIIITFALGIGEIKPKDIRIVHDDHMIPYNEINYARITYFKE